MYGNEPLLDSYQNLICSPGGNESVESIGPAPGGDSVEHAADDTTSDEEEHGRGASGDPYEDEADDALLRRRRDASTTDTYDGGDLSPGGGQIERAKGSGKPSD